VKWIDVHFTTNEPVDVQIGEIVDVVIDNAQVVHVTGIELTRQDKVGPIPMPRKPGDETRQHE